MGDVGGGRQLWGKLLSYHQRKSQGSEANGNLLQSSRVRSALCQGSGSHSKHEPHYAEDQHLPDVGLELD